MRAAPCKYPRCNCTLAARQCRAPQVYTYEIGQDGLVYIINRHTGYSLGYVHREYLAQQVVDYLNQHTKEVA